MQPATTIGLVWVDCIAIIVAVILSFKKTRFFTLIILFISLMMSLRYIWWRVTETLQWPDTLSTIFGVLLLCAEIYSWTVLFIAHFQSLSPLNRESIPLPQDQNSWPTVDVFVPTYNEDLEIVKVTLYAALGIDWPKDKIKVWLLDDGGRDSFKQFAQDIGVEYVARTTHEHAKAGNINHALKYVKGQYVAIFDCDHVANRDFLTRTMGFFFKDKDLALVQTPHHFFSPDPFERNLNKYGKIPNEGALFYGVIQDGNDTWNASFFCGSCAVIKKEPLLSVGGIAVETVTEDAHTALKLHRKGYNSAYLRYPLAAGLATETLSAHIGQRIRWARGMIQIFRLDNPFLRSGLTLAQRLCYFSAMLHYLSGLARIIFLIAPLAFLFFHSYIIYAPAIMVILYVIPHLVLAQLTNSLIQGKYRHSFWGEVYETVLSFYIVIPTLVALVAPHKGKFNVTAKGGLINREFIDNKITAPFYAVIGVIIVGLLCALYRIANGPTDEVLTVLLSVTWCFYNLIILGVCIYVSIEKKQVRSFHRVPDHFDATVVFDNEQKSTCTVKDFSSNGLGIDLPENALSYGLNIRSIVLKNQQDLYSFPVEVVSSRHRFFGLKLKKLTHQESIQYIACTFGRLEIWDQWQKNIPKDRVFKSLFSFVGTGILGYLEILKFIQRKIFSKKLGNKS